MDNLFKTLLIIILLAFLYLYYESSDNGRYIEYGKESQDWASLLDTKTGKMYYRHEGKIVSYDFPNATKKENVIKFESIK